MPETQIYLQDYVKPEKVRPISRRHDISRHESRQERHERHHERHHHEKYEPPKLGNPTPLGLSAFALSVMISAFYNLQAFGVTEPNLIVGVSLFSGGVVQFAAGMWEFKVGNTFGGTGFSAFGGFWASYGVVYIPGFGITAALNGENSDMFHNAFGVYCLAWLIFTIIFTLACIRTSVGVLSAFIFLSLTFAAETIYHFYPDHTGFIKAGGVFGMITSLIVWYCLAAVLLTPDLSPISLPLWSLARKEN